MAGGPEQCSICLEALDGGVTALACGHRFHAACLSQMAGAVGTAARTSRRGALTACPNCRTVSRVALTPVATFGVGDRVEALWGQKWYPGEVDAVVDGGRAYEIIWDDGEVRAAHVRAAPAPARTARPPPVMAPPAPPPPPPPLAPRAIVPAAVADGDGGARGARTASSRFWGVTWNLRDKKWRAAYRDANGKNRHVGQFDDEEEAARARDQAIRDAGLEGKRRMNTVDATGAPIPHERPRHRNRSAVVAPDPARDPTATTSKFWGVSWDKRVRWWDARYVDADGKRRHIGHFDTQEAAAHAVNAAIRRAGLEGRRRTNTVIDGQLVPKPPGPHNKKRRRDEPAAAAPSTRPRN